MYLTLRETEKLMISVAAMVAQNRKDRGVKLNHPESVAIITNHVIEGARDGKSVAELMQSARGVLSSKDVMSGVATLIPLIQVECTFPDGTKLVSIHNPISE